MPNTRTLTFAITVLWAIVACSPSDSVQESSREDQLSDSTSGAQKAVLVTGASTGIGRKITEVLAARGYFVYAGARKQQDLDELSAIENVQSIRLDVTKPEEIRAAVETVTRGGRGLYGLVNNAGVFVGGPMIEIEQEDLDFQFDVNVHGPYRITKAFSGLIIEANGRIVTIGSIAGIVSGPLSGPYSMSKHAVEAYTDALAAEMARFGVKVSVIEPGNYQSNMAKNRLKRIEEMDRSLEGSLFEEQQKRQLERLRNMQNSERKEPDEVAQAVAHALFDEHPKIRYMVVPDKKSAELTIRRAMQKVVELNQGQSYTFDRRALIGMLDESLKAVEQP